MVEEIILKFCKGSKFIIDLDGLVEYLDDLNLTIEEKNKLLNEVFVYNNKMYTLLVEENKKLEKIIKRMNVINERKELPVVEEEIIEIEKTIEPLNLDVNSYVARIKKSDNLEEIRTIISNKNSINTMIIVKLFEEVYEIKKMLYQDRKNIDEDTKKYFENEIEKLKIKIEYIKQITTKNKNVVTKEIDENQMIFLKTNYGNVCAYSDIKDIPIDYYDIFYMLLESIRLGNFKNFKSINGDGPLSGVSEVKYAEARIVFSSINKNNYVILAMFLKKVNTDSSYRAYLINRKDLYENSKDIILESIDNLEYLEENRQIRDKIYSILKKEKIKKRSEIND